MKIYKIKEIETNIEYDDIYLSYSNASTIVSLYQNDDGHDRGITYKITEYNVTPIASHDSNYDIITVCTTCEERIFEYRNEKIDIQKIKLSAEEWNNFEKAKDRLYDFPLYKNGKIIGEYGLWRISQKANKI